MKIKIDKKKELRKFLISFFKLKKNFKGSISLEEIENWDSISHFELMIELEKRFKINTKNKTQDLISEKKILEKL